MSDPGTTTFYVIYEDGSIEVQTLPDGTDPVLNKPGRVSGKVEYDQYLARLQELNATWLAETHAREQQVQKADYDALVAAGIPDATARRITGYAGP